MEAARNKNNSPPANFSSMGPRLTERCPVCPTQKRMPDFHHEKSNATRRQRLQQTLGGVIGRHGMCKRLIPYSLENTPSEGGHGHAMASRLLTFKWQLCIFRANKWGGAREGSTTQTDGAHVSLVCPLRVWKHIRRLPSMRQTVMPPRAPYSPPKQLCQNKNVKTRAELS